MRKNILLFLFAILFTILQNKVYCKTDTATINIDYSIGKFEKISPYMVGNFIEYYMSFQNGVPGLWAQELFGRGFDAELPNRDICYNWYRWSNDYKTNSIYSQVKGGYNENGIQFQRINKLNNQGESGIFQGVNLSDCDYFDFYIYLRGDTTVNEVKLKLIGTDYVTLIQEMTLGKPDKEWKKYAVKFKRPTDVYDVFLVIAYSGTGILDLDEASLMPSNNVNGIRNFYFNSMKAWKPSILRYPGGWFVEYSGYKWQMGIGDIDKRTIYKGFENVRMDFGLDDYLRFCKDLGIEPYITVSFLGQNEEDAANLVEYCNSPDTTKFGKLRALNGHKEPYNVKFWEIGNEIWTNPVNYATGFVKYREKMRKVDSTISCLISGNIWGFKNNFDTLSSIFKTDCEYYGWHWMQDCKEKDGRKDIEIYLSSVSGSKQFENSIEEIDGWIKSKKLDTNMKQAVTEIWTEYKASGLEWVDDTTKRGGSLENGLWMACHINSAMRYCDKVKIFQKTESVATIRSQKDPKTGKIVYYQTPSFLACVMARNHSGDSKVPSNVFCNTFSTDEVAGLYVARNVPWLDVLTSTTKDTLYVSVINRNPYDTIVTSINYYSFKPDSIGKVYQLYSQSYLDANTMFTPNKVKITEDNWTIQSSYAFPPHSYTILAIPKYKDIVKPDDSLIVNVYPNPATDIANIISLNSSKINRIEIINYLGIPVLTRENENSNKITVNLKEVPSGAYYIKVTNNSNVNVLPLTISK